MPSPEYMLAGNVSALWRQQQQWSMSAAVMTVGRTESITHKDGSNVTLDSFSYTFDVMGRVAEETSTLGPTKDDTYDETSQLTGDGADSWNWDANGNQSGHTIGLGNQLESDGVWNYAYDLEGNTISRTNIATGEVWLYAYDGDNRLVKAEHKADSESAVDLRVEFAYDILGNRIQKSVDPDGDGEDAATVLKMAYDPDGNAWLDFIGSSSLITRRLYGDATDDMLARIDAEGTVNWYLADNLGSIRDIADADGTLLVHADWSAFGSLAYQSASGVLDRYGFQSRETDAELDMGYFRARYVFLDVGRWNSPDPLGFGAGDANLYRFVGNNPSNATDPSGLVENLLAQSPEEALRNPTQTRRLMVWTERMTQAQAAGLTYEQALAVNPCPYLLPKFVERTDLFKEFSNFSAGMGDTVSMGLTRRIRQGLGYDDVVNYNSGAYTAGQVAGTGVNIGLSLANPCALSGTIGMGLRGVNLIQATGTAYNASDNFASGNFEAYLQDTQAMRGSLSQATRPCFAAGTPLLTPDGEKVIEQLRPGDWVLAAPEDDPTGPVQPRQVEETFVNVAPILNLHVGGRIIATTAEHPFFVHDRGWITAGLLEAGDLLRSHDGRWVRVDGVADSGTVKTVYNLRVAEYHTYFVGSRAWRFSIWSHNSGGGECGVPAGAGTGSGRPRAGTRGRPDHIEDVEGPGRRHAEAFARDGESVQTERPIVGFPGINRRADNQVIGPDGRTRLVIESERRPTGRYHRDRIQELEAAGIEVITRPL